jgi:hypothetical protein
MSSRRRLVSTSTAICISSSQGRFKHLTGSVVFADHEIRPDRVGDRRTGVVQDADTHRRWTAWATSVPGRRACTRPGQKGGDASIGHGVVWVHQASSKLDAEIF